MEKEKAPIFQNSSSECHA